MSSNFSVVHSCPSIPSHSRRISTQMRAVLMIFEADDYLVTVGKLKFA